MFLLIGALAMFLRSDWLKGLVGLVAGIVIVGLQFKRPAILIWGLMFFTLFFAMVIVGCLGGKP